MFGEVIDGLEKAYADEPDILADCLVWLQRISIGAPSAKFSEKLNDLQRCPDCGRKLVEYPHKEVHYELDDVCFENFVELACPVCDLGLNEE